MSRIRMLIGGEWIGDDSDEWIDVYNPSNGEKLTEIVRGNSDHAERAVKAAAEAFENEEWRKVRPHERGQLLIEFAGMLRRNAEKWAEAESLDVGKPLKQALADVEAAARYFEFYGGAADKLMGDTIPIEEGLLNAAVLEPVGVTVHIIPWNYPLQIISRSVAAAIAMGNAVIVKSAEDTPMTANLIAELFHDSKIPKGIFQHVTGYGYEIGDALVSHPDINHITFTGSVKTGTSIMKKAAENIVPVTLELGGKSPNIVFEDCNEERAVKTIINSIIQNAGQTCSAGSRLIIEASYKERFLEKLKTEMEKLTIGPGIKDLDLGPVLNKRQFDIIQSFIGSAETDGRIVTGGVDTGVPEKGYYIKPTIIDEVSHTSKYAQDEIFGPVMTVFTFETAEEAIALANGTQYGLVTGIWTSHIDKAHYVASKVKSGQVFINNYGAAGGIQMPFGGYKKSGIGREKGFIALRNYTQVKNIAIKFEL